MATFPIPQDDGDKAAADAVLAARQAAVDFVLGDLAAVVGAVIGQRQAAVDLIQQRLKKVARAAARARTAVNTAGSGASGGFQPAQQAAATTVPTPAVTGPNLVASTPCGGVSGATVREPILDVLPIPPGYQPTTQQYYVVARLAFAGGWLQIVRIPWQVPVTHPSDGTGRSNQLYQFPTPYPPYPSLSTLASITAFSTLECAQQWLASVNPNAVIGNINSPLDCHDPVPFPIDCPSTVGPPPPPPPPDQFYNIWVNCTTTNYTILASTETQPPDGYTQFTGQTLFASVLDAVNYWEVNQASIVAAVCRPVDKCPPPPPPCPPPPPPPPPPPMPIDCSIIPPSSGLLAKPGSREWCAAVADIKNTFVTLGNIIIDYASGNVDNLTANAAGTSTFAGWVGDLSGASVVTNLLSGVYQLLGTVSGDFSFTFKSAVACWVKVLKAAAWCSATEILALSVLRSAVRFLHKLRVGTDAALWLTVDIEVDVEAVDKVIDYLLRHSCPVEIPSATETIDAWLADQIDDQQRDCWLMANGCDPEVWTPVIAARREQLTPEQVIEWGRRNGLDLSQIDRMLRKLGYVTQAERDAVQFLYDELPSIQDHLHWLQRNVFDDEYVADYGLMEGFDTRFWPKFGQDLRSQGMREEYAKLHYAAHWVQPSPGQLQEMMQRLRPGRAPAGLTFTEGDYLRLLAEQDIAPYFRERMRLVAYSVVALRFLRQLYDTAQLDDAELAERFQDLGYSPADSLLLAKSEKVNRAKRRATQGKGVTPGVAAQIYLTGGYTKDDIFAQLEDQGWTRAETDRLCDTAEAVYLSKLIVAQKRAALSGYAKQTLSAYATGTATADSAIQALRKAGYPPDAAGVMLQLEDIKVAVGQGKKVIAAVRKAFLRGEVDAGTAINVLVQGGITGQRAAQNVAAWQLEFTPHRQQLATGKVLDMVKRGLLSPSNASSRLANLGWSNPDIMLLVESGIQDLRKAEQAALSLQQRQAAARAKAAEQLVRDLDKQKKRLQQAIAKDTPPAKLIRWYGFGIINEDTLTSRLKAMGYDDIALKGAIEEAHNAKVKCDAKKAKGKPC